MRIGRVTVRGLAERNVTADLPSWTSLFSEQGPSLAPSVCGRQRAGGSCFFRHGFTDKDLSDTGASVNQFYDNNRGQNSVTVRQRIQLRTNDVMRARAAFARQADLIRGGVALEDGSGMVYSFTRLNQIKPEMIAEATKNACDSALQFARDSGTGVGGILSATQVYSAIGARDRRSRREGVSSAGDSPFRSAIGDDGGFHLD